MSDDLDNLIRKAASAHLALAPASVLTTPGVDEDHDLIARAMRRIDDPAYLAQLEPFDPEAVMMSDPDHDDDTATSGRATPPSSASDDSGLHDIRALAQNAKQRISRKMPAIKDSDDSLLASTTGQLKAIALPEPARLVMLPDMPSHPDAELARATAAKVEARGAAMAGVATASDVAAESVRPKKRTALWLGLGGAAAAAAVIAVVASGGSKSKDKAAGAQTVAVTTPSAPTIESAAGGAGSGSAAPTGAIAAADPGAGGPASATPPAAPRADEGKAPGGADERHERDAARDRGAVGGDDQPKAAKPAATSAPAGAGAGSGKDPKASTGDKGAGDKPPPDKGEKGDKAAKGAAGGAPTGGGAGGEKSIDDLLGDVGSKPPPPSGGDGGAKPEKKGLDGKDIKAGMAPLASKAQGCYDQHGVAGHVKIKAVVDPSGKVTKVDATGEFAGTPTGTCVAGVVKAGASFPAWDGAPMTVNYSYTLNE